MREERCNATCMSVYVLHCIPKFGLFGLKGFVEPEASIQGVGRSRVSRPQILGWESWGRGVGLIGDRGASMKYYYTIM